MCYSVSVIQAKIAFLCNTLLSTLSNVADGFQHFGGTSCFHLQGPYDYSEDVARGCTDTGKRQNVDNTNRGGGGGGGRGEKESTRNGVA